MARSLRVRIAAAKTALTASRKTGRPVDPQVGKLAELRPGDVIALTEGGYGPGANTIEELTDSVRHRYGLSVGPGGAQGVQGLSAEE